VDTHPEQTHPAHDQHTKRVLAGYKAALRSTSSVSLTPLLTVVSIAKLTLLAFDRYECVQGCQRPGQGNSEGAWRGGLRSRFFSLSSKLV
jgi:hypothetical protein